MRAKGDINLPFYLIATKIKLLCYLFEQLKNDNPKGQLNFNANNLKKIRNVLQCL